MEMLRDDKFDIVRWNNLTRIEKIEEDLKDLVEEGRINNFLCLGQEVCVVVVDEKYYSILLRIIDCDVTVNDSKFTVRQKILFTLAEKIKNSANKPITPRI